MFLCHTEARSNPRTPLRAASMLCSICHGPDVLSVMSFQMTYASVYQDKQAFSLKSFKINTQEACLLNCIHMCPHFHCTLFESILHHNVFYGASLYCTSSPQWRSLDPLQVPGFMNTMQLLKSYTFHTQSDSFPLSVHLSASLSRCGG